MARRVRFFDSLRGLSVLSMVGFHLCYDLRYLAGLSLPWFQGTFQNIWRATISWVFLFLAGVMSSYSRNNYRRAAKYGLFAFAIFAVTTIAAVDDAISFGIIFCMAACTLVTAILETLRIRPRGLVAATGCIAAFLALLYVPSGYLDFGFTRMTLPQELYATPWLSWLGFPGPGFVSGDYYPVLPYLLMYLSGASFNALWKGRGYPERLRGPVCRPLEFVGRHALAFYVAHQPLILAALWLALGA